jgi:hypothetical protein
LHDAVIAVEVRSAWEGPSLFIGESPGVLAEEQLSLHTTPKLITTVLHQHIVIVGLFYTPEHCCVIWKKRRQRKITSKNGKKMSGTKEDYSGSSGLHCLLMPSPYGVNGL